MPTIKTIAASIAVPASAEFVFKTVTTWPLQNEWVIATKVSGVGDDSHKLGGKLEAFTGVGKFGFLDTMTITKWDPPYVCEVTHTGSFVKGSGLFEISVVNATTYFTWTEITDVPFGIIGKIGWPIAKPFVWLGLKISLMRFKRLIATIQTAQ